MAENQISISLETLVAYPLMIIIGFYMTASAIVPFLQVYPPIFTVVFTLSGAIPAVTLYVKEKRSNLKQTKQNEKLL